MSFFHKQKSEIKKTCLPCSSSYKYQNLLALNDQLYLAAYYQASHLWKEKNICLKVNKSISLKKTIEVNYFSISIFLSSHWAADDWSFLSHLNTVLVVNENIALTLVSTLWGISGSWLLAGHCTYEHNPSFYLFKTYLSNLGTWKTLLKSRQTPHTALPSSVEPNISSQKAIGLVRRTLPLVNPCRLFQITFPFICLETVSREFTPYDSQRLPLGWSVCSSPDPVPSYPSQG